MPCVSLWSALFSRPAAILPGAGAFFRQNTAERHFHAHSRQTLRETLPVRKFTMGMVISYMVTIILCLLTIAGAA